MFIYSQLRRLAVESDKKKKKERNYIKYPKNILKEKD